MRINKHAMKELVKKKDDRFHCNICGNRSYKEEGRLIEHIYTDHLNVISLLDDNYIQTPEQTFITILRNGGGTKEEIVAKVASAQDISQETAFIQVDMFLRLLKALNSLVEDEHGVIRLKAPRKLKMK